MTVRGRHTLGVALSGGLVLVLLAAAWFVAGPRGGRPQLSADTAGAAATGATGDRAGRPGTAATAQTGGPGPAGAAGAPAATDPPGPWAGSGSPRTGLARPPAVAPATNVPEFVAAVGAARLKTLPPETTQVVIVSTGSFTGNTATLEAFTKVKGHWQPAFPPMAARIGQAGFADRKSEGDMKTPTGVYAIDATMYGIAADPGVRYAYHRVVENDWWNENPDSPGYNTFFHGANPGGASEALWQISPQYRYFAVINYNVPVTPANPPLGSGIFLHVANPGKATAGCVSLAESDLLAVLRWLEPGAAPRMVLAPRTVLNRY